jgi:hypothetical protein
LFYAAKVPAFAMRVAFQKLPLFGVTVPALLVTFKRILVDEAFSNITLNKA